MKNFTRALAVAMTTAGLTLAAAGSASAALIPNPYSTTSGVGSLRELSPLGAVSCAISNVMATGRGTPDGAQITVTGGTVVGCGGSGGPGSFGLSKLYPFTITIARGVVTVSGFNVLASKPTGRCLYSGTLTGTAVNGGSSIRAAGTVSLVQTLTPFCALTLTKEYSLTLPGATITW